MPETCENRCERCIYTERGYDEYSHEVYAISKRCPIYENTQIFFQVNHRDIRIELMTSWVGCNHFVLDEAYKIKCEETEKFLQEMHKNWEKKRAENDNKGHN